MTLRLCWQKYGISGEKPVGLMLAMNEWFAQGGGIGKFTVALGPSCCRCVFFFFHYSRLSLLASMSHPSPYSYFTSFPLVSSLNYSV